MFAWRQKMIFLNKVLSSYHRTVLNSDLLQITQFAQKGHNQAYTGSSQQSPDPVLFAGSIQSTVDMPFDGLGN